MNVLDATDNLVPKVVLKDMKGTKNAYDLIIFQKLHKYICFDMNHTQ